MVDDFLKADDPRVMAEGLSQCVFVYHLHLTCIQDVTDKFDHTFLFGDLNFRLDISRLHADWLISRQGNERDGFEDTRT
jgi:hypothetical protein